MDFERFNDLEELLMTYSKACDGDEDIRSACEHLVKVFQASMREPNPLRSFIEQLEKDAGYASWKSKLTDEEANALWDSLLEAHTGRKAADTAAEVQRKWTKKYVKAFVAGLTPGERQYILGNSDFGVDLSKKFEGLFADGKYTPLGELVAQEIHNPTAVVVPTPDADPLSVSFQGFGVHDEVVFDAGTVMAPDHETYEAMRAVLEGAGEPDIETLIENSSLGTPEAQAIRAQTPPEVVDEIMEKLREADEDREPGALGGQVNMSEDFDSPVSIEDDTKRTQVGPHAEVGLYRVFVVSDESDALARAERIVKHHDHLARSAEVTKDGLRMASGVLPPDVTTALLKIGGILK